MAEKAWKQTERRVARKLGSERTGVRGKETPDIEHPLLWVEVKHLSPRRVPGYALWRRVKEKARKTGRVPLIIYHPSGTREYIVVTDLDFLRNYLHQAGLVP